MLIWKKEHEVRHALKPVMEDTKANIIATVSIVALLVVIIVARVTLKLSKTFYLIAGIDISLILAVICFLIIRRRYNRERKILVSKYVSEGRELRIEYSFLRKVAGVPTKFKLEDLEEATDGFRIQIGKGGSGSVFKGVLKDGSQVAVKRIEGEEKGEREFRSEVAAIASVQHKNLVRLYGYSSVNRQRFLVYAYIPNSSLDLWIFPDRGGNRRARGCLTWDQRYQVAVDVAKALAYLHHDCRSKILHLDVKPENILLDENYRAVVTDFGLSKLIDRDESRVVTEIRGTCGYLAPEWLLEHGISEKSDVYSYGIVLLEMIGGRRSIMKVEVEETNKKTNKKSKKKKLQYFPRIVNQKMRERKVMEIVDQRLEVGDEGQVMKLVCVALWCIQEKAKNRPDMAMVIEMLEGRVPVSEPPDSQLVVVDLLAAGDDDDGDATTGVRRVVDVPRLHIQRERNFRLPSICSSIISPISPR